MKRAVAVALKQRDCIVPGVCDYNVGLAIAREISGGQGRRTNSRRSHRYGRGPAGEHRRRIDQHDVGWCHDVRDLVAVEINANHWRISHKAHRKSMALVKGTVSFSG